MASRLARCYGGRRAPIERAPDLDLQTLIIGILAIAAAIAWLTRERWRGQALGGDGDADGQKRTEAQNNGSEATRSLYEISEALAWAYQSSALPDDLQNNADFQAGHAELIAGQSYIGQLEERVQRLLGQLRGNRRILWIVPQFHHLAFSGLHQFSPVSVLDSVLPAIQRGEITVVGITDPTAFERLMQTRPGIEAALTIRRLAPMSAEASKNLALAWFEQWPGATHEKIVDEAWELSRQFLTDTSAPGNIFKLLILARQQVVSDPTRGDRSITLDDLMRTLAELTGLPAGLLDERRRLDVEGLQQTFNARVLGQVEAVECLVERVAMMKAGLTDPGRPAGVFLFAGPTGTGKTEMAKTLAEWLFGSAHRMLRLDMSEFQTPEDLDRILGGSDNDNKEALVNKIREQPFSVILLDEFEKAHPRVWDVFLQVFDDGRLSDRMGQTANFRHAIIILTSNLGGAIPTGVSLGFGTTSQAFDPASVVRAVEQAFRKEFINRLDRVVVFRPLTRELMRGILEKELGAMLGRRGLRSRPWAVEWDEAAIDFLLDKGFTPDLGARPLRRAVERYLLSPLALTIVNHQVPAGDQFLFVTRKSNALDVQFVDPDAPDPQAAFAGERAPDDAAKADALSLTKIALQPEGTFVEIAFLREHYEHLTECLDAGDWQAAKAAALSAMQAPGFWETPERFGLLDILERRDRIEAGMRRAGSLLARLTGAVREHYPARLVGILSQNLYLLELACSDIKEERPSDAILLVTIGRERGAETLHLSGFAEELADMYRAWAKRRRMRLRVLDQVPRENPTGFRFLALVEGYGAYTILSKENGLHVLERPTGQPKSFDRLRAVVKVAPQTAVLDSGDPTSLRDAAEHLLDEADVTELKIVRRYRKEPSPLVRDSVRGWRTG